jgi:sugar phosphate permease
VVWWSAFTALTGAVSGLPMLLTVRFLFGAGEAGAYPNAARVLARWIPLAKRGSAQSLVITAGQLGSTLAPAFTQQLINVCGWRYTFLIFGLFGVVWAMGFQAWYRDDPAEDSRVNDAERRLIFAGTSPGGHFAQESIPWSHLLTSANVWLIAVAQTCTAFAAYLYMNWYPTYLAEGRQLSDNEAGWFSSLVFGGGAVGCLLGGVINDWLVRRVGNPRWTYSLYAFTVLTMAAVALTASVHVDSPVAASLCAVVASMFALSNQATFWSVTTLISGRHVAAVFGLINSMSVPGAFASSLLPGHFSDWRGAQGFTGRERWDPVFYIYSGVLIFGAMCWLFVNCNRSAVGEHKTIRSVSEEIT